MAHDIRQRFEKDTHPAALWLREASLQSLCMPIGSALWTRLQTKETIPRSLCGQRDEKSAYDSDSAVKYRYT